MVDNSDASSVESFCVVESAKTTPEMENVPFRPSTADEPLSCSTPIDVGVGAPVRHAKFFLEDYTVMVQVDQVLFNVHRSFLARDSVCFEKLLAHAQPGNAVVLKGVDPADFERLLESLYPDVSGEFSLSTEEDWTSVLHLAVQFEFRSLRALAIKRLLPLISSVSKILLGRRYSVEGWPLDGLVELCDLDRKGGLGLFMITLQDARRLGLDLEAALKIAHIRNGFCFETQKKTVRETVESFFDIAAFSKSTNVTDNSEDSKQPMTDSERLVAPVPELPTERTHVDIQVQCPADSCTDAVPFKLQRKMEKKMVLANAESSRETGNHAEVSSEPIAPPEQTLPATRDVEDLAQGRAQSTAVPNAPSSAEVAPDWPTTIELLLPRVSFTPTDKNYKVAAREIAKTINSSVHTMADLQRAVDLIFKKALDGSIETLTKPSMSRFYVPGITTCLCSELAEQICLDLADSSLSAAYDDSATTGPIGTKEHTSWDRFKMCLSEACRRAVATWEAGPNPSLSLGRSWGLKTRGSFPRQVQVIFLLAQLVRKNLVPSTLIALCVDTLRSKVENAVYPFEDLDRALCVVLATGETLDQIGARKNDAMDTLFTRLKQLRVETAYSDVHGRIEGLLDLRNLGWSY